MFAFTPMQSDLAKDLLQHYGIGGAGVDTLVLIKNDECFVYSSAALEIAKDLNGFRYLYNIARWIPRPVRDFCYKVFARNRYALFGRREQCMVPSPELASRFVGR